MTSAQSPQHRHKRLRSLGFNTGFYPTPQYGTIENLSYSNPAPQSMPPQQLASTPQGLSNFNFWPGTSATLPSRPHRPRAPIAHRGTLPYSLPEENTPTTSWGNPSLEKLHDQSRLYDFVTPLQDAFTFSAGTDGAWSQGKCEEALDIDKIVADFGTNPHLMMANDDNNILDLRFGASRPNEAPLTIDTRPHSRRLSGSSFSTSSCGPSGDMLPFEELPTISDIPQVSDFSCPNGLGVTTTALSPIASPRYGIQPPRARTGSRARTSSSPRRHMRSAPYVVDGHRKQRWSTGSFAQSPARHESPFMYRPQERLGSYATPSPSYASSPGTQASLGKTQVHPSTFLTSQSPSYHSAGHVFPPFSDPWQQDFENPAPLPSHGGVRMLQSNADPVAHQHYHYTDLSDPPDLFASLHTEQSSPPPEDMNPSDPDMTPHEQELRFEGDMYTPKWVRGHGNKREGWCGICKPGRWLVLKNSAFWYDKSFSHGISAATGSQFQEPRESRRMDGNPDVWEGLCSSCNDWIALVSSKKKGTTWFRHAYKCHSHLKIKDPPKRRRENNGSRTITVDPMSAVSLPNSSASTTSTSSNTPILQSETPVSHPMAAPPRKTNSPLGSLTSNIA
ncbi:MAG: hypothetical protein M1837_004328 [Sclerophora amabilis]|nr:MAG: hypothetical protein M1837_004328 [Sclerophora amabilis]